MADPNRLIAADAWRRAAAAAETAQLAYERLAVLERDGAAWLAIATAWRHATWAKNAAMAAMEDAASDGGPPEADLRGEAEEIAMAESLSAYLASDKSCETMPAVEPDAGPSEADLRGEVDHGA